MTCARGGAQKPRVELVGGLASRSIVEDGRVASLGLRRSCVVGVRGLIGAVPAYRGLGVFLAVISHVVVVVD